MGTKNYKDLSDENYKKQAQKNWSKNPCGSGVLNRKKRLSRIKGGGV